ncbi:MAG TPA: acyl-CoA desaturase, partial [Jatrophihabitantaceae bacterium]|nr:acyl-CoA desaturase [Jatrophihabitantaceae bacterium]
MTLLDSDPAPAPPAERAPKPTTEGAKRHGEQFMLYTFVIVPFLAFLAAIPVVWGWGLNWTDVILFVVFYYLSGLGVTVGFHRLFTHGSFKANRGLRIALAAAGSLAVEGPVIRWVADHRRHHAFSDR